MSINLTKGQNSSLGGLSKVTIGLGWDPNDSVSGHAFDLDAACFMLSAGDKLTNTKEFVFFNSTTSPCGSVRHHGDNREGEGEGDDESISVDLTQVPHHIVKLTFCVQIYDSVARQQNFGQVNNSYVRVIDEKTGEEKCSSYPSALSYCVRKSQPLKINTHDIEYELQEDFSSVDTVNVAELYKRGAEWKFRAIGRGYQGGFAKLIELYK